MGNDDWPERLGTFVQLTDQIGFISLATRRIELQDDTMGDRILGQAVN
jgi:hypothetical protein